MIAEVEGCKKRKVNMKRNLKLLWRTGKRLTEAEYRIWRYVKVEGEKEEEEQCPQGHVFALERIKTNGPGRKPCYKKSYKGKYPSRILPSGIWSHTAH
jgi:hypothetical protein